jgi:hypothetical protein
MQYLCFLMVFITSSTAFAGDLWEVSSTSFSLDGTSAPYTQRSCFPKDGLDLAKILGGLGNCTIVQKSGNSSAMTFSMTCKTQGIPAELASMNVTGDSSLNGSSFNMHYVITVNFAQGAKVGDFKMSGTAEAHKLGQCDEH